MLEDFTDPKVCPLDEFHLTMYSNMLQKLPPRIKFLVDVRMTDSSDKRLWVLEALENQREAQRPCCSFRAEFEKGYNRQVYDPVGLVPQKEPFGFFELIQNVNTAYFKWQILAVGCEKSRLIELLRLQYLGEL